MWIISASSDRKGVREETNEREGEVGWRRMRPPREERWRRGRREVATGKEERWRSHEHQGEDEVALIFSPRSRFHLDSVRHQNTQLTQSRMNPATFLNSMRSEPHLPWTYSGKQEVKEK